jgi:lambda family phage portal protein
MLAGKQLVDMRTRDALRNDGHLQSGSNIHKDGIVGSMFLLNAKPETKILFGKADDAWEEEFQEETEAKFTLAAESPNCWFDAAGSQTLTGLIRLALGIYTQTGEVLATAEWLRGKPRPFSTAIQMVDLDRLQNPFGIDGVTGSLDGRIVRGGVHQDSRGAPIGYYIRNAHPADYDRFQDVNEFTYVPVKKPWGRRQVIHIKEQFRASQSRAVADIVASLKEIKITKKFRDITLQQAVVQAMYAASIESDLPPEAAYAAMGVGQGGAGLAVAKYGTEYLKAVAKFVGPKGLTIDNVKIPHFFPGTRLNLRNSGAPGGVGQEFEQSLLRYIASTLGVSYEQLSKDYSKTNYSSARAALTETWKFQQSRKRHVADKMASMIYMLWFEEQMNKGGLETMKFSKAPNFYDGLNAEAYCNAEWIGAARGQIDELKETQAAVLRLTGGLSTAEDELARFGRDWRKVYKQLAREQAMRKELNLVFSADAQNQLNAVSGTPQSADDEENGTKQNDKRAA